MKVPKYNIGDMFFLTYNKNQVEITISESNKGNVSNFVHIPCVCIIKEVKITKKGILYTIEEQFKTNDGILKRTTEEPEQELNLNHTSIHSLMEKINEAYVNGFNELVKSANKEKLSDVLHGE